MIKYGKRELCSNFIKGEASMLEDRIKVYVTSYSEEVTGSNNHVIVEWPDGRKEAFVVDCGLFQEKDHNHINAKKFPYKADNISFAIATHVHTDHVGRFPYLVASGFAGRIYCSYETCQLLPVVLAETAERLEDEHRFDLKRYKDCKEKIKKLKTSGKGRGKKDRPTRQKCCKKSKKKEEAPHYPILIFGKEDIEQVMKQVVIQKMYQTFEPVPGIEMTFYPNAHIGGAILTVCRIYNEKEEVYLLFTGDLGLTNPVTNSITDIPDEVAAKIDIIVSESTYGSAEEAKNVEKERQKHMEIIRDVYRKNGTIMYMSNSLERPLRVGVDIKDMQQDPRIENEIAAFNVYFDSTFGIKCFNKYAKLFGKEYLPDNFATIDKDTRDQAVASSGPKMIICTSPRLYQGSFLNYGAKMLENSNVTLVFVAYVPDEIKNIISLPSGAEIDFMGEKVKLRCKRYQFGYYSSHVSTEELDAFLSKFPNATSLLFNHGTHDSKNNHAARYKTCTNTTHNLLYGRAVMLTKSRIEKYF